MKILPVAVVAGMGLSVAAVGSAAESTTRLSGIRISPDARSFVTTEGAPFFYLGDTAWGLFQLSQEEAEHYLQDRAAKKFTVIQAVVCFWVPLDRPNPAGHTIFIDSDPRRPNPKFFEHVDWVVNRAAELGLRMALVPIWSRGHVTQQRSILDQTSAREYGRFLGRRYREHAVFWILGGDWDPYDMQDLWRAMAAGLEEGDGGKGLKTFHARSPHSSAQWFNDDAWLDFNMLQTGHSILNRNYELVTEDYTRHPVRPVIDGEPGYEDITERLVRGAPRLSDYDTRRFAYCAVFAGAAGHTYGADRVYGLQRARDANADSSGMPPWKQALQLPGAGQMQHLRALVESRPMLGRVPDQWMIVEDIGTLTNRIQACRGVDGSYALVYTASGRPFTLKMRHHLQDVMSGTTMHAHWFDPRTGEATRLPDFEKTAFSPTDENRGDATREFTPPTSGPGNDWVLVVDDASKGYPAPGKLRP